MKKFRGSVKFSVFFFKYPYRYIIILWSKRQKSKSSAICCELVSVLTRSYSSVGIYSMTRACNTLFHLRPVEEYTQSKRYNGGKGHKKIWLLNISKVISSIFSIFNGGFSQGRYRGHLALTKKVRIRYY